MQKSVLCILLLPSLSNASLRKIKPLGKFYLTHPVSHAKRDKTNMWEKPSVKYTITVETWAGVFASFLRIFLRISSFTYVYTDIHSLGKNYSRARLFLSNDI